MCGSSLSLWMLSSFYVSGLSSEGRQPWFFFPSVYPCVSVLGCVPIVSFASVVMGLTIMNFTIARILLRLRKQAGNDMDVWRCREMELASCRVERPVREGSSESES
ncbi:hypothetical protein F5146DRAFT_662300 [Armillaria mellea]|nr:hypothetical protein F5146DRAFT_662300 [Armillaria mellea]